VLFDAALEALTDAIHRFEPDVVISLGQADAYSQIAVEQVAVNLNSSEEPDNAGSRATDLPVVPGGPIAYWSSLPVTGIVAALRDAGIPAVVSYDAGGYVCNHLFYGLMHLLATERLDTIGGFVHLPLLLEQAVGSGVPSMGRETLVKAVEVIVSASSA
jgi:pyroglutamyl-peptidase